MPTYLLPLLVLGFSASLSNFGGAVGLGVLPLQRRHRLEIAGTFLLMEFLMPVIGVLAGSRIASGVGQHAQAAAGAVLVLVGIYTLYETRKETRDLTIPLRRRTMVLLAVALSLDNLVVGFGLGLLGTPLLVAGAFMGGTSLVLTVGGLELGRLVGSHVGDRAELLSGVVLIAAGIFVAVHG